MTAEEIQGRAKRHNLLQLVLAVIGLIFAATMWWISFWVLRICFYGFGLLLDFLGLLSLSPYAVGTAISYVGLLILVLEGMRYGWPALSGHDVQDYSLDDFIDVLPKRREGSILTRDVHLMWNDGLNVGAFLFAKVFCIAPHLTVDALIAIRSRVATDAETAARCAVILVHLERQRAWIPASTYADDSRALRLLELLQLIWAERRDDRTEIRYPPGN